MEQSRLVDAAEKCGLTCLYSRESYFYGHNFIYAELKTKRVSSDGSWFLHDEKNLKVDVKAEKLESHHYD